MAVNFNEVTKPLAAALAAGGTFAATLLADPNFLSVIPAWLKPFLVLLVAAGGFATVFYTPQAATSAQIAKAGTDAAAVITKVVVPKVAQDVKDQVQARVDEVVQSIPGPVGDIASQVSGQAGDLADQLINKFRVGI